MAVQETIPAKSGVPGVPAGSAPSQPVAQPNSPGPAGANSGAPPSPAKLPFGGNVGRKAVILPAGMVEGSPEHLQWKRDKEAARKRKERADKKLVTPPPVLPPSTAPITDAAPGPADSQSLPVFTDAPVPVVEWLPADFNDCAPEVVELLESAIIEYNTSLAADGGLPKKVVDKIAVDSSFPRGSKDSLRRTSPAMLAKFANSARLPVALKPYVSGVPSLFIIGVGQWKMVREIKRLIEEDKKLRSPGPEKTQAEVRKLSENAAKPVPMPAGSQPLESTAI